MKDYKLFNGKLINLIDEGTEQFKGSGLEITNAFGTVRAFNLRSNSLDMSFSFWFNTTKFDNDYNSIGQFDKYYHLANTDFTDFQNSQSETLSQFIAVMRGLCGATETAQFKHCLINPIEQKMDVAFYEDGILFSYVRDDGAFEAGWNGEFFAPYKSAMYQIAFGIAQSKDKEFWANAVNAE